ncbi:MAG: hypothetical protein QX195_06395 [Methylococcaceae bacterium]|jgi:hypothetical protein|nr:hypothetical protein [Methylovulum sp.]
MNKGQTYGWGVIFITDSVYTWDYVEMSVRCNALDYCRVTQCALLYTFMLNYMSQLQN